MSMHGMVDDIQSRGRRTGGLTGRVIDIVGRTLPALIPEITGDPAIPTFPPIPPLQLPPRPNGEPIFRTPGCLPGRQAAVVNGVPCCPSGFHFSKRTGCCVKNRKMNVMNMKAHARATRRIMGNARAQSRARKAIAAAAKELRACPRPPRRCPKCK